MAMSRKNQQGPEIFDPRPGETGRMPARPYRVLHANLPFYSDADCQIPVQSAYLVVLRCEDPAQNFRPIECMPTRRQYQQGQLVTWEINPKALWDQSWFVNPETGTPEKAWSQSVEFDGLVVRTD